MRDNGIHNSVTSQGNRSRKEVDNRRQRAEKEPQRPGEEHCDPVSSQCGVRRNALSNRAPATLPVLVRAVSILPGERCPLSGITLNPKPEIVLPASKLTISFVPQERRKIKRRPARALRPDINNTHVPGSGTVALEGCVLMLSVEDMT